VLLEPGVEILLKLLERFDNLLPERDMVELFEDRIVNALADAVRLRALRFRSGVIDVAQR
jgi:hypothetical protein